MIQLLTAYLAKALVLLLAAALLTRSARLSPEMRHRVWTVAFAAVLLLLPISSLLPPVNLGLRPAGPASLVLNLLLVAWLAVALLLVGRILLDQVALARLRRESTPVSDEGIADLARAAQAEMKIPGTVEILHWQRSMPVTFGIFRPVILLPATAGAWPVERLRLTLLHEMGHIARRDSASLLLSRVAAAIHWCNPLCLWALGETRRICEHACDDLVLRTGARALDYARTLIDTAWDNVADAAPLRRGVLTMTAARSLEGRVKRLLSPAASARSGRTAFVLAAAAVVVIGLSIAPVRLETGAASSYAR